MKNLIVLAIVAIALSYGSRSCSGPPVLTPQQPASAKASAGAIRQWEQAPQAVMDMQSALGSGGAGSAQAARNAVQSQLR